MGKYQPKVMLIADEIIKGMEYENFTERYNLTNMKFVRTYLCDLLTVKYINGELDDDEDGVFTEEEFDNILIDVVNQHTKQVLIDDGIINTYEDETTDEVIFLTDKGKELMEQLKNDIKDGLGTFDKE
jgi:hypothetical protein